MLLCSIEDHDPDWDQEHFHVNFWLVYMTKYAQAHILYECVFTYFQHCYGELHQMPHIVSSTRVPIGCTISEWIHKKLAYDPLISQVSMAFFCRLEVLFHKLTLEKCQYH